MSVFEFDTRLIAKICETSYGDLQKENVADIESYKQGVRDTLCYAINLFIEMQKEEREEE